MKRCTLKRKQLRVRYALVDRKGNVDSIKAMPNFFTSRKTAMSWVVKGGHWTGVVKCFITFQEVA